MEAGRLIGQPVPGVSGAGFDIPRSLKSPACDLCIGNSRVSFRPRSYTRSLSHGFSDSGHVQYYASTSRCVGVKEKSAEMKAEKKKKKKLKLMKRLSKDLASFSIGEVHGENAVSEARDVLLAELQHLRSREKEQRRMRKEEKAKRKAGSISRSMQSDSESSSSSSSESSSGSDCGEAIDMSPSRTSGQNKCIDIELERAIREDTTLASNALPAQEEQKRILGETTNLSPEICREGFCSETGNECSRSLNNCNGSTGNGIAVGASGRSIEVCMGGKCKKMGAVALMEEFQKKAGVDVAVVGCKCMGKCKNAPNVRVSTCSNGVQGLTADSFVEPPVNPLYIGVGLEDVGTIVAELLGKCGNDRYLMAPSLVN